MTSFQYNFFTEVAVYKCVSTEGDTIGVIEEVRDSEYVLKPSCSKRQGFVDVTPDDWEIRKGEAVGYNIWEKNGPPLFRLWVETKEHKSTIEIKGAEETVTYESLENKVYKNERLIALVESGRNTDKDLDPVLLGCALCALIYGR